jgi:predicted nucleic acid-binding Zn finger protein
MEWPVIGLVISLELMAGQLLVYPHAERNRRYIPAGCIFDEFCFCPDFPAGVTERAKA